MAESAPELNAVEVVEEVVEEAGEVTEPALEDVSAADESEPAEDPVLKAMREELERLNLKLNWPLLASRRNYVSSMKSRNGSLPPNLCGLPAKKLRWQSCRRRSRNCSHGFGG